jgi:hypothetical protein
MFDHASGKKLEGYTISLPLDYRNRVFAVSSSKDMLEFADAIIHNVEGVMVAGGGSSLNAAHVAGVISATISKMVEVHSSRSQIITAIDLVPAYLAALITNSLICQEAVTFLKPSLDFIRSQMR